MHFGGGSVKRVEGDKNSKGGGEITRRETKIF